MWSLVFIAGHLWKLVLSKTNITQFDKDHLYTNQHNTDRRNLCGPLALRLNCMGRIHSNLHGVERELYTNMNIVKMKVVNLCL